MKLYQIEDYTPDVTGSKINPKGAITIRENTDYTGDDVEIVIESSTPDITVWDGLGWKGTDAFISPFSLQTGKDEHATDSYYAVVVYNVNHDLVYLLIGDYAENPSLPSNENWELVVGQILVKPTGEDNVPSPPGGEGKVSVDEGDIEEYLENKIRVNDNEGLNTADFLELENILKEGGARTLVLNYDKNKLSVGVIPESIEQWDDEETYEAPNNYVSYVNTESSDPAFHTEAIYRCKINTSAGESPESHPEKWVYQGQTLGNITIDDVIDLRTILNELQDPNIEDHYHKKIYDPAVEPHSDIEQLVEDGETVGSTGNGQKFVAPENLSISHIVVKSVPGAVEHNRKMHIFEGELPNDLMGSPFCSLDSGDFHFIFDEGYIPIATSEITTITENSEDTFNFTVPVAITKDQSYTFIIEGATTLKLNTNNTNPNLYYVRHIGAGYDQYSEHHTDKSLYFKIGFASGHSLAKVECQEGDIFHQKGDVKYDPETGWYTLVSITHYDDTAPANNQCYIKDETLFEQISAGDFLSHKKSDTWYYAHISAKSSWDSGNERGTLTIEGVPFDTSDDAIQGLRYGKDGRVGDRLVIAVADDDANSDSVLANILLNGATSLLLQMPACYLVAVHMKAKTADTGTDPIFRVADSAGNDITGDLQPGSTKITTGVLIDADYYTLDEDEIPQLNLTGVGGNKDSEGVTAMLYYVRR